MKNRIASITLTVVLALSVGLIGCGGEGVPEVTQYNLTISSTEGGSVTTPGAETSTYDEGEVVNLVATPDKYYHFINWTGDVATIDDVNAASTAVTMNGDYDVTANFDLEPWDDVIELNFHCTIVPQAPIVAKVYAPWAAEVENTTGPDGGKFRFNFTYGDAPYNDEDSLTALSINVVDLGQLCGDTFHLGSLSYVPFLFPDMESCAYVTYNLLATEGENWDTLGQLDGVKILLASPLQLFQWWGNARVTTLADLAGLRVGCTAGQVPTIEALGATPVEITGGDMAGALTARLVDGCFISYNGGWAWGLPDVTQYNTELNLFTVLYVLAMNREVYEGLHPDARALLDTFCTAKESVEYAGAWVTERKATVNDYRASHGQSAIYVLPQEELENWRDACASVYTEWMDYMDTFGFDGEGVHHRAVELIAEYLQDKQYNDSKALSFFGKDSYLPIVENATWTYNYGSAVRVTNVDNRNNTFIIENIGSPGWMDGMSGQDSKGRYIAWNSASNSEFLPLHHYFTFRPLLYENSRMTLGFSWEDDGTSRGYDAVYPYHNQLTVVSTGINITTPGGQIYENCIVLQRDISYPNGYFWNPYLVGVVYYIKEGIGFVQEIQTWSNDSQVVNYLTSYSIP